MRTEQIIELTHDLERVLLDKHWPAGGEEITATHFEVAFKQLRQYRDRLVKLRSDVSFDDDSQRPLDDLVREIDSKLNQLHQAREAARQRMHQAAEQEKQDALAGLVALGRTITDGNTVAASEEPAPKSKARAKAKG